MVENLLKKQAEKEARLAVLEDELKEHKGDAAAISAETDKLKKELAYIQLKLADKQDKLKLADLSARMTGPERQMFDGTLVQSIAEQGKEVMHCATLLFLGMVDDATTFAETHGGGGSKSDLKWGRDEDEDNRAWALRCMRMASRMMKPAIGRKPKR